MEKSKFVHGMTQTCMIDKLIAELDTLHATVLCNALL